MKRVLVFLSVALLGLGVYAIESASDVPACPVHQAKCPAYNRNCPKANAQCPAAQAQCPVADCPYAGTAQCPAYNGNCPKANAQCPSAQAQCPVADCPYAGTAQCPAYNGNCPKVQAQQGCANPNWQRTSRCGAPMRAKKAVRHHRRAKSPCWRFSFCH